MYPFVYVNLFSSGDIIGPMMYFWSGIRFFFIGTMVDDTYVIDGWSGFGINFWGFFFIVDF